jgi:hypothetical protein
MTRDDIYDHLAQVYLGKRSHHEEQKKKQFNAWLLINIVITIIIFASSIYGLTAFLARHDNLLQDKIIYALNKGPIRINYNLNYPYPPVKSFALSVPRIQAGKFKNLQFSIRGLEEGYPGIMRVEIRNNKNEIASVIVDQVDLHWKKVSVPFEDFKGISDWTKVDEVSFILESWNAKKQKGIILIDDICFSS